MVARGKLLSIVSAATLLLSPEIAAARGEGASRRGPFAFQYAPGLTDEQVKWYSRFEILVTHDPLPSEQVRMLRDGGTRLFFYEWSVAFYESRATAWQRSLLENRKGALLNERALHGGVGSPNYPAWYFDPADPHHAEDRSAELVERLQETGYDGVFFDTTRFESVHPEARREFERRHPGTSYDAAFSEFLAALRRRGARVFTNQGYRSAEQYLPYVDWDLTESLITRPAEGAADLRPWSDARDPWNSIQFVLRTMIAPLAQRYPSVRFAHLNYVDAPSAGAIRAAVAVAQLFDGESFVAAQTLEHERDEIYFRDPGVPVGPRVDWQGDEGAHRFFTNGLVAVSASPAAHDIVLDGRRLRNHLTGEIVGGASVAIPPSPDGPTAWFFDAIDDCAAADAADKPR